MKKITLLFFLLVASLGFSQEDCAGVVDLATLTSPYDGDTTGAINDFGQDCLTNASAPDQVFSILVPDGFILTIGQTANNYDSKARLAYGATCPGDMLIDCNDDPDIETLTWTNSTGADQTAYWTQSAYSTGSGTFTLAWSVDAPPSCGDVTDVAATASDVEADLSWVAPISGTPVGYNWEIQPDGVAQGTASATAEGNTTMLMVTATGLTAETPYDIYVQTDCGVDGTANWVGPISFTTTATPPANDDFADAEAVMCGANYTGSTSAASLDEDDAPDGFGADNDAPNVWFSYTGTGTAEDVTASLCGSGYDTAMLVYTGTSGALTAVAGNDDSCGLQSSVTFPSDGTTTYYICVTGWNSTSTGTFTLDVTCVGGVPAPANDECVNAEMLTLGTLVTGTTVGATQNGAEEQPTCDTFATIADVWYTAVVPASGLVNVYTTITGTSTQAAVVVYSACGGLQADQLVCSSNDGDDVVSLTGLTPDDTLYIRVYSDGVAARNAQRAEGTFEVTATDASLSTQDFDNGSLFSYYPNPVNNTLSLQSQKEISNVSVFNMLGQEVFRNSPNTVNNDVDMSNLQSGAYFVKVTISGTTETIRVIKN